MHVILFGSESDQPKLKVGTILSLLRPMILDCTLRYHIFDTICTFGWSMHKIRNHQGPREDSIYMSFSDREVRIEKNFTQGLEWTDRDCRPRSVHSRPRTKIFTIRTDQGRARAIAFIVGFANDACNKKKQNKKSIQTPVTDSRNF